MFTVNGAKPAASKLFLDGAFVGSTPLTSRIVYADQRHEISCRGYRQLILEPKSPPVRSYANISELPIRLISQRHYYCRRYDVAVGQFNF